MYKLNEKKAYEVAYEFQLPGEVKDVIRHRVGHINDTFIVSTICGIKRKKYVLQRINTNVFPDPRGLMENINIVTETIREKVTQRGGEPDRESLTLVDTRGGSRFYETDEGDYWRCYLYVDGETYDNPDRTGFGRDMAREAARAFANFQKDLMEIDISSLNTTIKDFHNTPIRFENLLRAIDEDPLKRSSQVRNEIEFCLKREGLTRSLIGPIDSGNIPIRATHNDTKINNVIFERNDGGKLKALCVIDLDTVMPGGVLFDFGDQVRTTVSPSKEDERNISKIDIDLGLFDSLIDGYINGASSFLTEEEIRLLALSGRVITFETALRFLTDYIKGDVYFKINRPEHNLDRARTQLKLVECMEKNVSEMERIVLKYLK